jgi:hypothetical protein
MKPEKKSVFRSRGLVEIKISIWPFGIKTKKPDHVLEFPIEHFEITPDNLLVIYPIGWKDPELKGKAKLKKALKAKAKGRKA